MLSDLTLKGEIQITPARYDLDTGKVELMEQVAHAPQPGH
jgi:hypothetical protein